MTTIQSNVPRLISTTGVQQVAQAPSTSGTSKDAFGKSANPTLASLLQNLLADSVPAEDDTTEKAQSVPASPSYTSWQNQLATLAQASPPDVKKMLEVADAAGIPKQTAVSDIIGALGLDDDGDIAAWLGTTLEASAEGLDDASIAILLTLFKLLAEQKKTDAEVKKLQTSVMDMSKLLTDTNKLVADLQKALADKDRRDTARFDGLQAQITGLQKQVEQYQQYNASMTALTQGAQRSAFSDGKMEAPEVKGLVDSMAAIQAPGEAKNFVSAAEWNAVVVGVINANGTQSQTAIATGLVAQDILDRQKAGTIAVDPTVQDQIVKAAADGAAASASASASAAPAASASAPAAGASAAPASAAA